MTGTHKTPEEEQRLTADFFRQLINVATRAADSGTPVNAMAAALRDLADDIESFAKRSMAEHLRSRHPMLQAPPPPPLP